MANIKSQKKRIITNEKSRMRNRAVKSEIKTAIRHVKDAVAAGDGAAAYAAALAACRLLDKAVSKGVIHKNQAANRKSGVMALANTIVTDADRAAYVKPEVKPQEKAGSKKAAAKAARKEAMAAASAEKAKRREAHMKAVAAAEARKAKGSRRGRRRRGRRGCRGRRVSTCAIFFTPFHTRRPCICRAFSHLRGDLAGRGEHANKSEKRGSFAQGRHHPLAKRRIGVGAAFHASFDVARGESACLNSGRSVFTRPHAMVFHLPIREA